MGHELSWIAVSWSFVSIHHVCKLANEFFFLYLKTPDIKIVSYGRKFNLYWDRCNWFCLLDHITQRPWKPKNGSLEVKPKPWRIVHLRNSSRSFIHQCDLMEQPSVFARFLTASAELFQCLTQRGALTLNVLFTISPIFWTCERFVKILFNRPTVMEHLFLSIILGRWLAVLNKHVIEHAQCLTVNKWSASGV